jgi:hypothetical protein
VIILATNRNLPGCKKEVYGLLKVLAGKSDPAARAAEPADKPTLQVSLDIEDHVIVPLPQGTFHHIYVTPGS